MITKIILEGPNNVGKSKLAKELKLRYSHFEIEHLSEVSPNSYEFYEDLLTNDEFLILDRFALSEYVYSKLYERDTAIDNENLFSLLNRKDVLVIYVDADYDFVINACNNKDEIFDYITTAAEKQVFYYLYTYLADRGINIMKVKNHMISYFNILNIICEKIERINDV